MKKQSKAAALIVVVVVAVVGLYLFLPKASVEFHYERDVSDQEDFLVTIFNTVDCNLTISYTNDDSLLYRVDIELYEAGFEGTDVQVEYEALSRILRINEWYPPYTVRVKSIDVVLGNAVPCGITVYWCYNLNTSISYSNGAVLGREMEYYANGSLTLFLDEDVEFSDMEGGAHGMKIGEYTMPRPDTISLNIDLPTGLAGYARFGSASVSWIDRVGWSSLGSNYWGTESDDYSGPALSVSLLDGTVSARLLD